MLNPVIAITALAAMFSVPLASAGATVAISGSLPDAVASGSVDGTAFVLPSEILPGSAGEVYFGSSSLSVGGAVINGIHGYGDPDPFVSFSIGVTDPGAPSDFQFAFTIPLSPLLIDGTTYAVHSSLGVTLTSSFGAVATITPDFGNIMLTNVGSCAAGVDIGTAFSSPPRTSTTQSFSANGTFVPIAGCDNTLTAFVAFTGSGGEANYGLTGEFDILAVPEPISLALLAPAVLGVIGAARRNRT